MKEARKPRDDSVRKGFLLPDFPGRFVSWIRRHLDVCLASAELTHPHLINFPYSYIKLPKSKIEENDMVGAAMDDHSSSGAILLAIGMAWWVLDLQRRGLNIKYDDEGKKWQAMLIALTRSLRAVKNWRAGQHHNETVENSPRKRLATATSASTGKSRGSRRKVASVPRKRRKAADVADDGEYGVDGQDEEDVYGKETQARSARSDRAKARAALSKGGVGRVVDEEVVDEEELEDEVENGDEDEEDEEDEEENDEEEDDEEEDESDNDDDDDNDDGEIKENNPPTKLASRRKAKAAPGVKKTTGHSGREQMQSPASKRPRKRTKVAEVVESASRERSPARRRSTRLNPGLPLRPNVIRRPLSSSLGSDSGVSTPATQDEGEAQSAVASTPPVTPIPLDDDMANVSESTHGRHHPLAIGPAPETGKEPSVDYDEEIVSPAARKLQAARQASLDRAAPTIASLSPPELSGVASATPAEDRFRHTGVLGFPTGTTPPPTPSHYMKSSSPAPASPSPPPYNPMKDTPPP
jgi:hypothetical protein